MRSKQGDIMLRRLDQAGVPLDLAALSAEFNFVIFLITTASVDAKVVIDFYQKLRVAVRGSGVKSARLSAISVHPMILDSGIQVVSDSARWKKSEMAYIIKRNIDYDQWQSARTKDRKSILLEFMHKVILDIPERYLEADVRDALIDLIRGCI
jgi:hypothetical protein